MIEQIPMVVSKLLTTLTNSSPSNGTVDAGVVQLVSSLVYVPGNDEVTPMEVG